MSKLFRNVWIKYMKPKQCKICKKPLSVNQAWQGKRFKTKEERFYDFSRGDFTGEINGLSVWGNPVQIGLLRENLGKKFPGLRFHVVE
jgi:hypothetical protein